MLEETIIMETFKEKTVLIEWEYDPIKLKDGTASKTVLYGGEDFIISTDQNRWKSENLEKANEVTLYYKGKYTEHRYWGTLEQMKSLAQQIIDNQELFHRFAFLTPTYTMSESNWWGNDIKFNEL